METMHSDLDPVGLVVRGPRRCIPFLLASSSQTNFVPRSHTKPSRTQVLHGKPFPSHFFLLGNELISTVDDDRPHWLAVTYRFRQVQHPDLLRLLC